MAIKLCRGIYVLVPATKPVWPGVVLLDNISKENNPFANLTIRWILYLKKIYISQDLPWNSPFLHMSPPFVWRPPLPIPLPLQLSHSSIFIWLLHYQQLDGFKTKSVSEPRRVKKSRFRTRASQKNSFVLEQVKSQYPSQGNGLRIYGSRPRANIKSLSKPEQVKKSVSAKGRVKKSISGPGRFKKSVYEPGLD